MSITFSYVNYLDDATPIFVSSEETNFPGLNVIDQFRSKSWRTLSGDISGQYIDFDLGFQQSPKSFFLTNEQRGVKISENATIKVYGSNDAGWTTPEIEVDIPWHEKLLTKFSETAFGTCRFYRVYIDDPDNIDNYIEVGNIFLGDSIDFASTDLNLGWGNEKFDDSREDESDGGEPWFDSRAQKDIYDFTLEFMNKPERDNLEELFKFVGKRKPFYLSLDPENLITNDDAELAIYCRFVSDLKFTNPFFNAYNTDLVVKEAV